MLWVLCASQKTELLFQLGEGIRSLGMLALESQGFLEVFSSLHVAFRSVLLCLDLSDLIVGFRILAIVSEGFHEVELSLVLLALVVVGIRDVEVALGRIWVQLQSHLVGVN